MTNRMHYLGAVAGLAAAGGAAEAANLSQENPVLAQVQQDLADQKAEVLDSQDQRNYETKVESKSQVIPRGVFEDLSKKINVSPSTGFTIAKLNNDLSGSVDDYRGIPGVKIVKGEIKLFPLKTLEEISKYKVVHSDTLKHIFRNNPLVVQYFKAYINARLGSTVDKDLTGDIDEDLVKKTNSYLKNEQMNLLITEVEATYGGTGLKPVTDEKGRNALFYTDKELFAETYGDSEGAAFIEFPYFDENGKLQGVTEYTKDWFVLEEDRMANAVSVPGLNKNKVRDSIKRWLNDVKNGNVGTKEQPAKSDGSSDETLPNSFIQGPTILSGAGSLISGSRPTNPSFDSMINPVGNGVKVEKDLQIGDVKLRNTLELLVEANNNGVDSRIVGQTMWLLGNVGGTIRVEKGSEVEKFALAFGYKINNGLLKVDYGFVRDYVDVHFAKSGITKRVNPAQHGLALSYKQNFDRDALIREVTGTIRGYKLEKQDLGEIGKVINNTTTIFEQYKVLAGTKSAKRVEGEANFGLDLTNIEEVRKYLYGWLRVDIAPRVGYEQYDALYDSPATSKGLVGLSTRLTYLFPDEKTKVIFSHNIETGKRQEFRLDLAQMTQIGEIGIYGYWRSLGNTVKNQKGVGTNLNITNPFGWMDEDADNDKTFDPLFGDNGMYAKLTFNDLAIDPNVLRRTMAVVGVDYLEREIYIDRSKLPNSSEIEYNEEDGSFKQLDLDPGVNNIKGYYTSVTLNGAAFTNIATYFSVEEAGIAGGNDALRVVNFATLPLGTYRFQLPQDGGGSVILTFTVEKGSVKLSTSVKYIDGVTDNTFITDLLSNSVDTAIVNALFKTGSTDTSNKLTVATATAMHNQPGGSDFADGNLLNQFKNGTYTTTVMNGVQTNKFTPAEINQLKNGTMSNTAAESRVAGNGVVKSSDISDQSQNESTAFNLNVSSNFTGIGKSYSASGLPSGITINSSTGVISGTLPAVGSNTNYNVTVTCTDSNGLTATDTFVIQVLDTGNVAPSKNGENFSNLTLKNGSSTASMTFDENVAVVTGLKFKNAADDSDAGGTIVVASGTGTSTLNFNFTAPNVDDVYVELTVEDALGASRLIQSNGYTLN